MEARIMLIAPYVELAEEAKRINLELNYDVIVRHAYLQDLPTVLAEAREKKVDVIVSRGGIALKAAQMQKKPVVEIPITGFDILEALERAKNLAGRVAVVGFANIIRGTNRVTEILHAPDLVLAYRDKDDDVAQTIKGLKEQGFDLIVGDAWPVKLAAEFGLTGILVRSGHEALLSAYAEAERIARVRRQERVRREQLRTILNSTYHGIIAVDKDGRVTVVNPQAEKICAQRLAEVEGKHYSTVFPWLKLDRPLAEGRNESEVLPSLGRTRVILNKVPILVNNEVYGVVTTLQESNQIQEAQQKLKEEVLNKGHVAKTRFPDILGSSSAIRETIEQARAYSRVDSVVLIEGESGVGKELFAQAIHNASSRSRDPFVAVNCAAIPATLLESELFGYVRGAFTDARREGKAGLLEMAEGGTLFLDEIGEMDLSLQAKLLRVLQEKEYIKVGDNRVIKINVRMIAATNQHLLELVESHRFRPDLYYRLNVLSLRIPPLRDRKADIPLLVDHFLDQFRVEYGRPDLRLSEDALAVLQKHSWPGNVRELAAAIERAVVRTRGELIPETEFREICEHELKRENGGLEPDLLWNALLVCGGNQTKAAEMLGIDRTTLWRHLKRLKA